MTAKFWSLRETGFDSLFALFLFFHMSSVSDDEDDDNEGLDSFFFFGARAAGVFGALCFLQSYPRNCIRCVLLTGSFCQSCFCLCSFLSSCTCFNLFFFRVFFLFTALLLTPHCTQKLQYPPPCTVLIFTFMIDGGLFCTFE